MRRRREANFRAAADGFTQEWTFWGAHGERRLGTFNIYSETYGNNNLAYYYAVVSPMLHFGGRTVWDSGGPALEDRLGTNRVSGRGFIRTGMRLRRRRMIG